MISAYILHIVIMICIFAILSVSLNVALGYTGLINLGHVAFFGIGGYTSAILVMNDVPFIIAMLLAGVLASIFGLLLALLTNKFKGDYLALGTLGFSFVAYAVFLNWKSVTRGSLGIPGIPKPEVFGLKIASVESYTVFATIVLMISTFILWRLVRSRYGRLLEAVRDDAIGLSVFGKNVFKLKSQAMMISAFFAGIAGSVFAHYISYIDPTTFYLGDIVIMLTIVIVGGLASIRGSILASILIIALPELLRFVDLPSSVIGAARQIMYSAVLILILMFRPRGLFGKVDLE